MQAMLRRVALPMLLLLLAGGTLGPSAPLDNLWFKVKIHATGYKVADGQKPLKGSGTTLAYLHLREALEPEAASGDEDWPSLPTTGYVMELWTQGEKGWFQSYSDPVEFEGCDGVCYFAPDVNVYVEEYDFAFEAYVTALVRVKRDKEGNVTSATLTTLGGEIYDGVIDEGQRTVRGGVKITGKTVPESKLPFVYDT